VLRNALLPVITMAGIQVGHVLGGSVLVETVFGWPGLGRLAFESVFARDVNLLLGLLLFSSLLVVLANLATDLLYSVLDPRIAVR
jgi:peptide/nickel transport system permease protein